MISRNTYLFLLLWESWVMRENSAQLADRDVHVLPVAFKTVTLRVEAHVLAVVDPGDDHAVGSDPLSRVRPRREPVCREQSEVTRGVDQDLLRDVRPGRLEGVEELDS